jgi:nitrite reductase (NADH) small subunit/3-phenylpropionate/trans-cinnamate dioxygenase ferredoxin subunit
MGNFISISSMTASCVANAHGSVRIMTAPAFRIQVSRERTVMAEFQTVCRVGEVVEGEGKTVPVGDRLVAVFCQGGQYFAIDDVCPHMGASLSAGYVENGIVTCPWHAWRFRLHDGAWADNPRLKIGCYTVRVEGDEVQVQVPEPPPARTPEKK